MALPTCIAPLLGLDAYAMFVCASAFEFLEKLADG
jgi:hypothetical protein